jgi:hypothetical protein
MVSHSNMPYADCVERARRQDWIARFLGLDLVVGAVALTVRARAALARRRARRQREALARQRIHPTQPIAAAQPDQAGHP